MPSARGVAWARFRVIVVLVAAVSILTTLVYLLSGGTLLQEQTILYLYIPDATGLEAASPVRVNGVDVGKVQSLTFSGSNLPNRVVRLTLKVEREHLPDITVDATAQISSAGVLGDKYVDITKGVSAASVQPEGEVRFKPQAELLKTLDLEDFVKQLRTADAELAEIEQGKNPVGQFVLGTAMYRDLEKALGDLDRGFRNATSSTSGLGRMLSTDEHYRQIRAPVLEFDEALGRIQAGQGSAGRLLREDGQYAYYRDQATSLRRSIAELRTQEYLASDQMYAGWNRELGAWIARVDQFNTNPGFSSSQTYDNVSGSLKELRTTMDDFRRNPKKYLRIQVF